MSRIGKKAVTIPDGVKVSLSGREVKVTGKLGTIVRTMPAGCKIEVTDGVVKVTREDGLKEKKGRIIHGLARSLINGMVIGTSDGFAKTLDINGIGYKVEKKGNGLHFSLGYSHPIVLDIPKDLLVTVGEKNNFVEVKGYDKQLVGEWAAKIRSLKVPEPYQGTGVKYRDEVIKKKVGKTGA